MRGKAPRRRADSVAIVAAALCLAGPTAASAAQRRPAASWPGGNNYNGELGGGTTTNSSTPVPVGLPVGTRVTAIAAGTGYSLALTSDGSILGWGWNGEGELGNATTANRSGSTSLRHRVLGRGQVRRLMAVRKGRTDRGS